MKILDRYIYISLALSFIICSITILGFYTLIDFFEKLDKFIEHSNSPLSFALFYYFIRLPLLLYFFAPMTTLMSSMATIAFMSRANELLPLKALGISMYRLMRPFFIYALFVSFFMISLQEFIVPSFRASIKETYGLKKKKVYYALQFYDRHLQMFFYIKKCTIKTKTLEGVRITLIDKKTMRAISVQKAQSAIWQKDKKGKEYLLLRKIKSHKYSLHNNPSNVKLIPQKKLYTNLTLTKLFSKRKHLELYSSWELIQELQNITDSNQIAVTLHTRITVPLSNLCLLLLGLPFILNRKINSIFLAIIICIILCAAFYGVNALFLNLGYRQVINPIMAAWFSLVFFTSLGIALIAIIHT